MASARDVFSQTARPECITKPFVQILPICGIEWLTKINELGKDVKNQKLRQVEWQKQTEELFKKVDLPELLKFVKFDALTKNVNFVEKGARSLRPKFPKVAGLPKNLVFGRQIFALKKGRSVIPHGHNNMATAFLILKGDLAGKHYDRLEDAKDHLLIKPTDPCIKKR